jgi:hypothetical protein
MEAKISTGIAFLIIFLVIIPMAIACYRSWRQLEAATNTNPNIVMAAKTNEESLSSEEKRKIDLWIKENNLNEYGDPKETFYAGGTPLFNEMTGEKIDKYEYILKKHPEKPWNEVK